ncbi:MAG TPA: M1 family metallopeptidase [Candidatus Eisenbacteria bacterium]|jgi:alanyl aminopeptidase
MRSFPLLVAGWLMIGSAMAAPDVHAEDPARLGRDVVPTFESIQLDLDAAKTEYSGRVRIDLRAHAPADSFRLHAREMSLTRVTLRGHGAVIPAAWREGETGLLTVRPAKRLAPGTYTLEIAFTNDFNTRATSLYRVATGGNAYVFSQFEAPDAREAFPCWDEPSFKIPWQVTLTVPKAHRAFSNTLAARDTVIGEQRRVVFHRTPPLPSYLLAIATGPLETVPIRGLSVPGRVVTIQGSGRLAAEAARETPAILAALERYFGRKYPYEKLDLLAVPEFTAGAMENAGAVTFREEILLMDPKTMSPSQRRGFIGTTAHELAHMWFGDLVTMEWWDDIWLNESFASWMGDKITDEVAPEFHVGIEQVNGALSAMSTDSRLTAHAIRGSVLATDNLDQIFDVLAYQKGEAVIGMLERWLGPDTFRKGVQSYIKEHASGNATADDLWAALSKAAGRDVSSVAKSFLDQPGVPLVTIETLPDGQVRLSQRRFLNYGLTEPGRALWRIPVTLRYPLGDRVVAQNLVLDDSVQTVRLENGATPAWINPNADEKGYYRWLVPPGMLDALAKEAPQRLAPRERIGFVGNLRALLAAGQIHGDQFLNVLSTFAGDPEPEVVQAVVGGIGGVKSAFVTDETRKDFAAYVRRTLRPALDRIGAEPAKDEPQTVALLRPALMAWLGDDGEDSQVLDRARSLAQSYLKDRSSIDPSVADVAIGLAALRGDASLFEAYRQGFESARIPAERQRYLKGLSSFTDPALVGRAMRYALEGPMRPQEVMSIANGVGSRLEFRDLALQWTLEHYDAIVARIPAWHVIYLPWQGGGCSAGRAAKAREFFSVPAHSPVGTAKEVDKMLAVVNDCVSLHEREGAAAARYLSQLAGMK